MKFAALGLLLLGWQGAGIPDRTQEVDASPQVFRYERAVQLPAGTRGRSCAVLDAWVYAHTSGELSGMRLYKRQGSGVSGDVPFVTTESGEAGQQEEPARLMNLGRRDRAIVFDLAMPHRAYTEVSLDLNAHNFMAEAKVSGGSRVGDTHTELGEFALFDLTAQRLSRSTTMSLQEASFPVLHVELTVNAAPGAAPVNFAPGIVRGATVPPTRYAQTVYTTVAQTNAVATKNRESVSTLHVPGHVPVERVTFALEPEFDKNFSRTVRVTAKPAGAKDEGTAESVMGTIQRVRLPGDELGHAVRQEQMSVEAVLGSNLREDADVEVAVENGDDAPLPLQRVDLQMRQRELCFDAEADVQYVLRYGDDARVRPPVYDYARLFRPSAMAATATLGPETLNPEFRQDERRGSYLARHPEILWIALLVMIAVLGGTAVHSAKVAGKR